MIEEFLQPFSIFLFTIKNYSLTFSSMSSYTADATKACASVLSADLSLFDKAALMILVCSDVVDVDALSLPAVAIADSDTIRCGL